MPNQKVAFATKGGREVLNYVVFEMELSMTQHAGQPEEQQKLLLMEFTWTRSPTRTMLRT